jgi:hypothetical protein
MAKPNYRQQKKQKEQARLTRQAEKLKRRSLKHDENEAGGVVDSAGAQPGAAAPSQASS